VGEWGCLALTSPHLHPYLGVRIHRVGGYGMESGQSGVGREGKGRGWNG
jgi:hypothetical protein